MDKTTIIKSGALFSTSSRIGVNADLTLDDSVYVKLYKNAPINIGINTYHYGPITPIPNINPTNPAVSNDNFIILEKGSKYHINNINIDPIGLTKILDIPQKVNFNSHTSIILPSNTILHTVDNSLEFSLTKAIHCELL
jgi:hypothetical protein